MGPGASVAVDLFTATEPAAAVVSAVAAEAVVALESLMSLFARLTAARIRARWRLVCSGGGLEEARFEPRLAADSVATAKSASVAESASAAEMAVAVAESAVAELAREPGAGNSGSSLSTFLYLEEFVMSMELYARAGVWLEWSEKLRLGAAVAESALAAPSASAVEGSIREIVIEVEWREEKARATVLLIAAEATI